MYIANKAFMTDLSEFQHPINVLSSGLTGYKYIKPELIRTLLKDTLHNLSKIHKCFLKILTPFIHHDDLQSMVCS